nr:olfactory receptor 14I1-like [Anolis sagrei ordinatus]
MSNQSLIPTEFILHGFSDIQEFQPFHFLAFLFIYLIAAIENVLIITVIIRSHHLHKPMYFFMANLAFQDLGSISVTVPKSMENSLRKINTISYSGCICQVFFLLFFTISHFYLLGIMAYDRYIAICNPLKYETIMNKKACIQMAMSTWISGFGLSSLYTGSLFTVNFCSNDVNQFFCEIPQLLKIACSDTYIIVFYTICAGSSISFIYISLIITSYIEIFRAVLRITSSQRKPKAFSTCLPHLIVIVLYITSGSLVYLRPMSRSLSTMDLVLSVFYCMLPPLMNPLIYSIRNSELKRASWKLIADL